MSAYKSFRDLQQRTQLPRSLKAVRQAMLNDIAGISQRTPQVEKHLNPDTFIPFLQERSRLGKRIQGDHTQYLLENQPRNRIIRKPSPKRTHTSLRKIPKPSTPAVGSYFKPESWTKPSFSVQ